MPARRSPPRRDGRGRRRPTKNPRHPARVPLVCGGASRLAPVPPCSSVLPPGAGNEEAEKAVKTDEERAKKAEERTVGETCVVQGHLDAPSVRRHDDGDMAAIPAIEQTHCVSRTQPGPPGRFAQSTRRSVIMQPPGPHVIARARTKVRAARAPMPAGHDETAGRPAVSAGSNPRVRGPESLLPALSGLEHESRACDRGHDQEDPKGLSLEHPGHQSNQRRPAPIVRAIDATSANAHVRRTRLPFTSDSFRVCRSRRLLATGRSPEGDPWLCVPASRRVCPGQ
jgi:hypothetical protein